MKIAFISDINSNFYALKSVLDDIKKEKNTSTEIRFVEYDFEKAAEDLLCKGLSTKYAEELISGGKK